MGVSEKRSYEFGPFRLDPAEYALSRDGLPIPLTPKVYQTLLVLVENSGRVVDKDRLLNEVWHDAFVEETNLTKNISVLRKVLSDGDSEGPYIETVSKRGYRFVAPVLRTDPETSSNGTTPNATGSLHVDVTASSSLPDAVIPAKTRKYVFAAALGITALVLVGVGFGLYKLALAKKSSISLATAQISRLTTSGAACDADISPDGKWLVYVEQEGTNYSLWLKQVAVPGNPTRIAGSIVGGCGGVAISPDGNYVYYSVIEPGGQEATLYRMPVLGGESRKLFTGIIGPVTFSPDSKQIAYMHWINDEDRLMIANADGSDRRQLAARSGNECFVNANNGPAWSPDGKTILTSIGTYAPEMSMTLATVSPDDGSITLFTQQTFQQILDLAWLSDGQSVLVVANDQFNSGGSKIWQISYPDGETERITNDLHSYATLSLTADSTTLATVQFEVLGNLWTAPMNDAAYSQVTSGTYLASSPSWTPDGKVIYASNSSGNFDLYLLDPRDGSSRRLTVEAGNNKSPAVSPDGRYVVFTSDRSGIPSLWRIDIDGSNAKQLNHQTSLQPSFSPDGRTIVYTSVPNKYMTSTISIDGGVPQQIGDDQSFAPVFSPDGTQIALFYPGGPDSPLRISIVPSGGGPLVKELQTQNGAVRFLRWTPDGKAFLYPVITRGVANVWMQTIEGGAPKQLTNFTSDLIFSFDVSRDGKHLVFSRGTTRRDVVLFSGMVR